MRGPRKRLTAQQKRAYANVVASSSVSVDGARIVLQALDLEPLPAGVRVALLQAVRHCGLPRSNPGAEEADCE
jgi:hypothetical protein